MFENGDNPAVTFLANPDATGANTSATVAQFTARVGGQPFAGTITNDLPTFTLNATNSCVKIKVWKPVISDVGIKFETGSQASTGEIKVPNTVTNQWEELTFDFSGKIGEPESTDITGFVLFPDFAARAQDNVIYFDDIQFLAGTQCSGGGGGGTPTTVDFEGDPAQFDFGPDGGFGGGVSTVIANPDPNGLNTSAQVVRMEKFAGAVFGGSTLALPAGIDWSQGETVTMKVWSQRLVPVLFKLEGLNQERSDNHDGGSQWQELCYDFTGATAVAPVTGITVIFDLGVAGDAGNDPDNWVFYYDDIQQTTGGCAGGGGGGTGIATVDFEPGGFGQTFAWTVFENGDNPAVALLANPDATGANTSATVAQFTARPAGQAFAGAITNDLPTFTLNATNSCVKIKVWKPVISDVGIKFETGSQASTGEIKVPNTVTNQWEELTFDFSGKIGEPESTDITGFVLFPDFAARAQDNVIYFDDIRFLAGTACGGGGGAAIGPVDFEPSGLGQGFTWNVFENGDNPAVTFLANPDATGANTSATVAQFTARVGGQPFAGTITNDLPTFTLNVTNSCVKIKVWKPVISDVGIKFETGSQASTGEIKVPNTVTNQWEELTFDFSGKIGEPESADITGFIVFPDFAARTQDNVVYFDDIVLLDGGQCP